MKTRLLSFCVLALVGMAHAYSGVTLTVPAVSIAPGSTSHVMIYVDLGAQAYTAYQLDIAYPDGISSVSAVDGNPAFQKGEVYSSEHNVSSIRTAGGLDRFQCFAVNSAAFTAQSGTLLILPIKAQKTLAEGTYQATISPIEFVQTDATPDRPEAITFDITVSRRVLLEETSTLPPAAASGVDVTVRRTIQPGEWSTICLPFAMTEQQVKTTFGADVLLGDFRGYETVEDKAGELVGITVNFNQATAMEANHPYLIKVFDSVYEFTLPGVDITPVDNPVVSAVTRTSRRWSEIIGTYVANTTVPEQTLFLSANQFWYSVGLTRMKAFRAYFDFSDLLPEAEGSGAAVRAAIVFEDESTGLRETVCGQALDEQWHDLSGRHITKTQKHGVYVIDGKTVVR